MVDPMELRALDNALYYTTPLLASSGDQETGPDASSGWRTTGWPRLTSTSTGRRLSSTTWGDYDNGYSGNDLDHAGSGGTGAPGDRRGGISEKTRVPVFAAEDVGEKLGSSARSYIRQIDAWSKLTRTPRDRQALLLYQNLQGRAWIEAEELQVTELADDMALSGSRPGSWKGTKR